jgi:polysaccharide pyruvyl transferase WcaK-like protein
MGRSYLNQFLDDETLRVKKILIVNAWGGNRGDEAMINTLFRLIKASFPEVLVDLLSFRDEILDVDSDISQISDRVGIYYYSSLTPVLRKLVGFLERIKLPKRGALIETFLRVIRFFSILDLAFMKKYDLIISAPQGPTISDIYTTKIKTVYPLSYASRFKVPYVILGVSMGPFDPKTKDDLYVYNVLSNAAKIVVREDISLNYVKEKYPKLNNITSAIDLVYADLLTNGKRETEKNNISDFVISNVRPLVGACISMTPARTPKNLFDKDEYIQQMSSFFDYVIEQTGGQIVLFPHLDFDMPHLRDIIQRSSFKERFSILPPNIDSDGQQDILRSLDFFISSRYHPTIFAIKAELPIMCIINQFKTEGMLNKLSLTLPVCWQDESLEDLKKTFLACWVKRDEIKASIKTALYTAKKEAEKYKNVLNELSKELVSA